MRIYLAGKVEEGGGWRRNVCQAQHLSVDNGTDYQRGDVLPTTWPIRHGVVLGDHALTGPYYARCFSHGTELMEGVHGADPCCPIDRQAVEKEIVTLCFGAIKQADLLFAWIDSLDCYGTLAEIGYAKGVGVLTAVGVSPGLPSDAWFVEAMVDVAVRAASPREALYAALSTLMLTGRTGHPHREALDAVITRMTNVAKPRDRPTLEAFIGMRDARKFPLSARQLSWLKSFAQQYRVVLRGC